MATTNDPSASPSATTDGMAMFGPHVVALIDLLGQTHVLDKWNYVPTNLTRDHPWVQAVRDSVGVVEFWRERFELEFKGFQEHYDAMAQEASAGKPESQRRMHEEYRKTALLPKHFSDTLIFYSPLQNEHGYLQVRSVIMMIVTCGALFLYALTRKTVFRGAVEMGVLTQFKSGDPYGPALARAHHLESKVADFPRIVVGPALLSYLDSIDRTEGTEPPIRAIRALARTCRTFLAQDPKGCWFVDYLSDAFANAGGDPASWRKLQADAYAFIGAERTRFVNERNDKLAERYERLLGYFRAHGSS